MNDTNKVDRGVQTRSLESWAEFYSLIDEAFANSPAYIFRGQADASWRVESSLDRLEKRYPTRRNHWGKIPEHFNCCPASRETHLRAFRQAMRGRRGLNPPVLDDVEAWALAQHHGLASPMLDWTLSPFVALYFAFEAEHSASHRAVYALSSSIVGGKSMADQTSPCLFAPTAEISDRLVAQSGLLLRMPEKSDLETYVQTEFTGDSSSTNCNARAVLIKVVIKNCDRVGCLKMLNKMNINRMTLFPDLDGAAQYINSLWEIDFDTSLGYIDDSIRD